MLGAEGCPSMWQRLVDSLAEMLTVVGVALALGGVLVLVSGGGPSLWDWVVDNKEWVFSGAGVAVVGGVTSWLLKTKRGKPETSKKVLQEQESSPGGTQVSVVDSKNVVVRTGGSEAAPPETVEQKKYSEHPTPLEIQAEIFKRPPLQQEETARNYVGLKVRWGLVFTSAWQKTEGRVSVTFREGEETGVVVSCAVELAQYPQLKIAHEGVPVRVTGEIESAKRYYIELRDARLEFE